MKLRLVLFTLITLSALITVSAQDWQSLFDSKTLYGWKVGGNETSFKVIDGQLACGEPRAHLFYVGSDGQADFTNFEFSTEVLTKNGANSGVYFHTEVQEIKDKQAFMDMLVARTVTILSTEPVDVYVNPMFLPAQIAGE